MTADNPTPQPTNTKARFDAEKIEAGYKYLDSLRELMGVGQPAGEGGVQDPALRPEDMSNSELDAAMDYHRKQAARYSNERAKMWRFRLDMPSGPCEVDIAMENERQARRATQPATAPSGVASPVFRTTKEAMEYAAQHEIPTVVPVIAPANIDERVRRAAEKVAESANSYFRAEGFEVSAEEFIDIIATEFK